MKTITFVRQPLIEHSLFRISFISCEFQFSVGIDIHVLPSYIIIVQMLSAL